MFHLRICLGLTGYKPMTFLASAKISSPISGLENDGVLLLLEKSLDDDVDCFEWSELEFLF